MLGIKRNSVNFITFTLCKNAILCRTRGHNARPARLYVLPQTHPILRRFYVSLVIAYCLLVRGFYLRRLAASNYELTADVSSRTAEPCDAGALLQHIHAYKRVVTHTKFNNVGE